MKPPTTLLQAVTYFSDLDRAYKHFEQVRWPNGAACPRSDCGSANVGKMSANQGRRRWRCRDCRRDFTAKVGTIFEDSPLGLDKWLPTIWMLSSAKNGISSMELSRALGVTQKTAWFMLHRVRVALRLRSFDKKLSGEVEADETFVGGRLRNLRRSPHGRQNSGTKAVGPKGKAPVLAIVQRDGEARSFAVPNVRKWALVNRLLENIDPKATVYTDSLQSYRNLRRYFADHQIVNHAYEYVRGAAHVNTVECFWSVFKRTIGGTYVCPSPEHLDKYLAEHTFRFNSRKSKDGPRFEAAAKMVEGKRLMYRDLIKHIRRNPGSGT